MLWMYYVAAQKLKDLAKERLTKAQDMVREIRSEVYPVDDSYSLERSP